MKVIHTKTQEQFNKVLEIFEKKGRVTSNGRGPLYYTPDYNDLIEYSDYFGFHSKKTDYSLFDNTISFEEFLRLEGIEPTEEYTRGEEIQYKGRSSIHEEVVYNGYKIRSLDPTDGFDLLLIKQGYRFNITRDSISKDMSTLRLVKDYTQAKSLIDILNNNQDEND